MVSVEILRSVCIKALVRAGVPRENAGVQVDLWLQAELRGHPSHGFLRLPRIVERIRNGVVNPATTGSARWRSDAFLEVDGENGLGPVVANACLDMLSERAQRTGVALGAITNNNHLGMLAIYAERVAEKGQILIALTTSEALVHPWGGRRAMLGTNPVAIGVPADPPFVLDMATSKISMGKVHDYANRDAPLQAGWAVDREGNPTTDAAAAKSGALTPFGDAKGYALGLAFEVLVVALTNSALGQDVRGTLDSTEFCNKGDVFIVIEPAGIAAVAAITEYLHVVRTCDPFDAESPVSVPGDRARRSVAAKLSSGISVAPELWAQLCELAGTSSQELGI